MVLVNPSFTIAGQANRALDGPLTKSGICFPGWVPML